MNETGRDKATINHIDLIIYTKEKENK
jgi:hypothetical protein